jgi:hypothetical protein
MGYSREEAKTNIREAMEAWLEAEGAQGRTPLVETPALVSTAVSEALEIIEDMRQAAEAPRDRGYELELATVGTRSPAIA